jgi:NhaP-type Na+/H+ or K+/H+ antiporter
VAVGVAGLVIICLLVDWLFRQCRLPGLIGMLAIGVVFGPHVLGLLSPDLLAISNDLRLIALIVILLRAGLELSRRVLHRVGKLVLLLSAIPALFEGVTITLLGPQLLSLTYMESAILGAILAAVSPAVVVPLMIEFIERRMGAEKGIPTLMIATAAIDDVLVIVVYSVLIGIYVGQQVDLFGSLIGIPISIVAAVLVGLTVGYVMVVLFSRFNPRATKRALLILGISILLVHAEHLLKGVVPFASLLAVMAIGFMILEKNERFAHEISSKFGKVWVLAEIVLFTLVGAQVDIAVALQTGLAGAALIALGLLARSAGSWVCLIGSDLTSGERLFVVVSYLPKATVQAAIGAAPLVAMQAAGMPTAAGEIILAAAVLSIVLTAPLGAVAIMVTGNRVLQPATAELDDARQSAIESESKSDGGI